MDLGLEERDRGRRAPGAASRLGCVLPQFRLCRRRRAPLGRARSRQGQRCVPRLHPCHIYPELGHAGPCRPAVGADVCVIEAGAVGEVLGVGNGGGRLRQLHLHGVQGRGITGVGLAERKLVDRLLGGRARHHALRFPVLLHHVHCALFPGDFHCVHRGEAEGFHRDAPAPRSHRVRHLPILRPRLEPCGRCRDGHPRPWRRSAPHGQALQVHCRGHKRP
mmetsp:Transcript_132270/g.282837  ORF Transcript_132270/g.282837 Transcript_132270/m.282837 type:complete len:220 (+) Transcript_132270:1207-1866(+)